VSYLNRVCGPQTACTVLNAYSDLCGPVLGDPNRCVGANPNAGQPVDCPSYPTASACNAVAACEWSSSQGSCVVNPNALGVF